MIEAVIWDFGGVLTSSPFEAFNRYERERGLPADFIRRINATNPDTNAWALFERSECTLDEFDELFAREAAALGHEVRGRAIVELLSGDIRPAMVEALRRCKARAKVGCITNNVSAGAGAGMARSEDKARAVAEVMEIFDHVIESSKIGIRKPDPRIYQMACETLGVSPDACVYLDDLGINLKPAAALGMKTIKVVEPAKALAELEAAVGFPVG
ncbi:MAG: HAD-IA family hydrolase [Parvibaculum sp.]|jgi:putative hydrolase of the HAD superfamily|uniref:HAD-IA family hydrolase n=1 Tax=Parvibaculum sp. TaxID=2024848 RepID=UPI00283E711D|nr:HAD-IA family hydrolase [Parvibaculum sp.]MDR3500795.1 HAD-IA family hydrolase [Parvibaculum sp.]